MKRFILIFIFCSSCQQSQQSLSNWWGSWKDYTITQFASVSSNNYLNAKERRDLLYLFEDLITAKTCRERQELIEGNQTLKKIGERYKLVRGYLFDVLFNYDYEKAITQIRDRSLAEKAAFTVVNVWKTSASTEQINWVIDKVSKCYPEEYL